MKKFLIVPSLFLALGGCLESPYQKVVDDYVAVAQNVNLGMNMQQVDGILAASQAPLSSTETKRPDKYIKSGVNVDIVYYRSGWNSDGLTTDDEFTPYIFNDGKLVAIGWQTIGGPKSQGQASDSSYSSSSIIVY